MINNILKVSFALSRIKEVVSERAEEDYSGVTDNKKICLIPTFHLQFCKRKKSSLSAVKGQKRNAGKNRQGSGERTPGHFG